MVEPADVSRVEPRDANLEKVAGVLHYTHCAAHGSETIDIKKEVSSFLMTSNANFWKLLQNQYTQL